MTRLTLDGILSYTKAALRVGAFLSPLVIAAATWATSLTQKVDALGTEQKAAAISMAKLVADLEGRPTVAMVSEKIDAKINEALMRMRIMESLAELKAEFKATNATLQEVQNALRQR